MPARVTKRPPAKAKADKSAKSIEKLLTSPKSLLASADLFLTSPAQKVLTSPMAWTALERHEQAEILALFPDQQHVKWAGTSAAEPNLATLVSDNGFRNSCATYTENVAEGRHDAAWLEEAWTAHARRKAGAFDAHLAAKFEEEWGVVLPMADDHDDHDGQMKRESVS
ncbi:conidiation protein 6 domain-containing protein [Purpureocillium lavendulum]|uniref:Conidiation protein 6 domain-containing protein n=1 Tax=Purpureocillium lavendulum TaxID=1247861 RepID=A0AB34FHI6_9HYPO|nr:conidiation protein 6 domain-containing protein [Purpureocillium lavendulum]